MRKVLLGKLSVEVLYRQTNHTEVWLFSLFIKSRMCQSEVSTGLYADLKRFIISRGTSRLSEW